MILDAQGLRQGRQWKGLTQQQTGEAVGTTRDVIAAIEGGRTRLDAALAHKLELVLAAGLRQEGEEEPMWLLAQGGPPHFYLDARHLPAVFLRRELADAAAELMRWAGEADATVVGAWEQYAWRLLTLAGTSSRRVVWSRVIDGLDRYGEPRATRIIVERVGRFVAEVAEEPRAAALAEVPA